MFLTFDRPRAARGGLALLGLALVLAPALASGQASEPRTLIDIKRLAGDTLADVQPDDIDVPEGVQAVTGYRVRHVAWRSPWTVSLQGRRVRVSQAWHVQLFFARPLSVRSQAFSLVVDGRWCGFLAESGDLRSADAVCFDPALVRNGATLAATYRPVVISQADDAGDVVPEADFEGENGEPLYAAAAPLSIREVR